MTLKCKICRSSDPYNIHAYDSCCFDKVGCRDRKIAQLKKELRRERKFIKMLQEGKS